MEKYIISCLLVSTIWPFGPLVVYVNNFVRDGEISHILEVTLVTWSNGPIKVFK